MTTCLTRVAPPDQESKAFNSFLEVPPQKFHTAHFRSKLGRTNIDYTQVIMFPVAIERKNIGKLGQPFNIADIVYHQQTVSALY